MIKPLYKYVIPGIFTQQRDMMNLNVDGLGFFQDLDVVLEENNLDIDISYCYFDISDENVIDLVLELNNSFREYNGTFYVTWQKNTLECNVIWFSGFDKNDETIFLGWDV